MPKPQPYYARFTQPPRSPNGRNRQAASTNHSDPLNGAGASAGGAKAKHTYTVRTQLPAATWQTINSPVLPFDPRAYSRLNLVQAMIDLQKRMLAQAYGLSLSMCPRWNTVAPAPIPYTGIHSGELTGHRAWLVTDDYSLCSLAHYFVWEPGKTIEGDINELVNASFQRYGGVYAYRDFENLRDGELMETAKKKHRFPTMDPLPQPMSTHIDDVVSYANIRYITYLGLAYGTVKLWGETVEHEKGYRASFAKVTEIDGFIGVGGFELDRLKRKYLP